MEFETEVVDKTRDAIELSSEQQGVIDELRSYRGAANDERKTTMYKKH